MENLTENAGRAVEKIDSGRAPLADALESASGAVSQYGDASGNVTLKTAQALGSTAAYIRTHDVQEMMCDAEEVARQNPLPSIIGAAAFGFLLGAFLRRS